MTGDKLYHITELSNLGSIERRGLIPHTPTTRVRESRMEGVHVFEGLEGLSNWEHEVVPIWEDTVLLEVTPPPGVSIEPDPYSSLDEGEAHGSQAFRLLGRVPPGSLKVVEVRKSELSPIEKRISRRYPLTYPKSKQLVLETRLIKKELGVDTEQAWIILSKAMDATEVFIPPPSEVKEARRILGL